MASATDALMLAMADTIDEALAEAQAEEPKPELTRPRRMRRWSTHPRRAEPAVELAQAAPANMLRPLARPAGLAAPVKGTTQTEATRQLASAEPATATVAAPAPAVMTVAAPAPGLDPASRRTDRQRRT